VSFIPWTLSGFAQTLHRPWYLISGHTGSISGQSCLMLARTLADHRELDKSHTSVQSMSIWFMLQSIHVSKTIRGCLKTVVIKWTGWVVYPYFTTVPGVRAHVTDKHLKYYVIFHPIYFSKVHRSLFTNHHHTGVQLDMNKSY
jgi:hypothetical protein